MSPEVTSILAFSLLGVGVTATIHGAALLGSTNGLHKGYFRLAHRASGYIFFIIYLCIAYIMLQKLKGRYDPLAAKDAIHTYLGFLIFPMILAKICIVKLFKRFYNRLPIYGIIVLFTVFLTALNAVHYILFTFGGNLAFFSAEKTEKASIGCDWKITDIQGYKAD